MRHKKLLAGILAATVFTVGVACLSACDSSPTVTVKVVTFSETVPNESKITKIYRFSVNEGETVEEAYGRHWRDWVERNKIETVGGGPWEDRFYTDRECLVRFADPESGVSKNITLYHATGGWGLYAQIGFIYNGGYYKIFREKETYLTAEDFSRSAYGYGAPEDYAFYSDEELTHPLDISAFQITGHVDIAPYTIYVGDAK